MGEHTYRLGTRDLLRLAIKTGLEISDDQRDALDLLTTFMGAHVLEHVHIVFDDRGRVEVTAAREGVGS